ncbi:ATP-binding protein [Carboxylicivirga linearis]|uniref:Ferredoxin family protein n=1 Tax=Carboxylicivirga linearis TaxID=1628157 RepID=A0ABS5JW73_9BACT|nr:ferredoxin family protein [Carboxylicivirga linearis]MBS2099149.1 ferredoxin family protein [Carboxylicivirga linearis]
MSNKKITICACSSRSFVKKYKVAQLATELQKNGNDVTIIADLCELVQKQSPKVENIAKTAIIACYSRAIQSQMNWLNLQADNIYDIRNKEVADILTEFNISSDIEDQPIDSDILNDVNHLADNNGTDAWYPVLDKTRCTNCGKCHDFCLFGVYTIENKEVKVIHPENCKNNCPACARICPSSAIIFPKYEKSPINGGTELEEVFSKDDMEEAYQKRLEYRLKQNRSRFSLLKKDNSKSTTPINLGLDLKKE